jgi:hypothetical protein
MRRPRRPPSLGQTNRCSTRWDTTPRCKRKKHRAGTPFPKGKPGMRNRPGRRIRASPGGTGRRCRSTRWGTSSRCIRPRRPEPSHPRRPFQGGRRSARHPCPRSRRSERPRSRRCVHRRLCHCCRCRTDPWRHRRQSRERRRPSRWPGRPESRATGVRTHPNARSDGSGPPRRVSRYQKIGHPVARRICLSGVRPDLALRRSPPPSRSHHHRLPSLLTTITGRTGTIPLPSDVARSVLLHDARLPCRRVSVQEQ